MAFREAVTINDRTAEAVQQIRGLSGDGIKEFLSTAKEIAKRYAPVAGAHISPHPPSPKLGDPRVKGGNLRNSIQYRSQLSKMDGILYTTTGYGAFLELGTRDMAARPFLAPAVLETIQEFSSQSKWGL